MKNTAVKSDISLQEAEEHYQLSSENYNVDSGESHLAYYREKHPFYYQILLNNVYISWLLLKIKSLFLNEKKY